MTIKINKKVQKLDRNKEKIAQPLRKVAEYNVRNKIVVNNEKHKI